ncbi:peroxisome- protein [Phlyctochytrium bullatum]|nr:peroxisome- protein [Phlyctochytrium bullatum]
MLTLTGSPQSIYIQTGDKFLWGIVKQGCQCRDCGYNVHKKCAHLVATPCPGVRAPGVNASNQGHFDSSRDRPKGSIYSDDEEEDYPEGSSLGSTTAVNPRYLSADDTGGIPIANGGVLRSRTTAARSAGSATSPLANELRFSPPKAGMDEGSLSGSGSSGSIMQDLLASTAQQSVQLNKQKKEASPPLNLLTTTPRNFTRFVSRIGPVVDVFDTITDIMTWKEPANTVIALLSYIILCIYPVLFVILPQIFLIYLITRNYYRKTKLEVVGKKSIAPSSTLSTTSAQYIKNMQFIQNQMGMFCDVHGEVSRHMKLLDWSNEKDTMAVLKAAAGSAVVVVVVVRLIPVNVIMLVAGVGAFFANTAFFRAASTTLPPVIIKGLADRVDSIREGIAAARKAPEGSTVTVTLFENQRWWAGLGWIPHLLRSERAPWSDETGSIPRPSKDQFELPANDPAGTWTWVDPDWRVDRGWTQVDETGWCYTDHVWSVPKDRAAIGSLTRRRAWVRQMKITPNGVVGSVAAVVEGLSKAIKAE